MHVSAITILVLLLSLLQSDAVPHYPHQPYPNVPGPVGPHVSLHRDGWLQAWIHYIQMHAFPWVPVSKRPTVKTTASPTTTTKQSPLEEGSEETSGGKDLNILGENLNTLLCVDGAGSVMQVIRKQLDNAGLLLLLHPILQNKLLEGLRVLEDECDTDELDDLQLNLWNKLFHNKGEMVHDAVVLARIIERNNLFEIQKTLCNMEPIKVINGLLAETRSAGFPSLVSDDMAEQLVDILQDKQLFLCMNYTKDTMEGGMRVSTSRRSMEKKAKSSKALVRMSLLLELVAKQVPVRLPAMEMMLPDNMKRPCVGSDCLVVEPPCEQTGNCSSPRKGEKTSASTATGGGVTEVSTMSPIRSTRAHRSETTKTPAISSAKTTRYETRKPSTSSSPNRRSSKMPKIVTTTSPRVSVTKSEAMSSPSETISSSKESESKEVATPFPPKEKSKSSERRRRLLKRLRKIFG